jgi:nucleoside-diphosphate-sugar epimerase
VTGAAGFIGRHVVDFLVSRGHNVVALQHRIELPPSTKKNCKDVFTGDICDPELRHKVLLNIDSVCHIAAYIPDSFDNISEAEPCYRVNALATLGLATAAVKLGIKRFVYLSAANMYSHSDKPASEEDRVFPSETATYYLMSKLAGEVYLMHVSQHTEMNAISLRIGTPYGPGEPIQKVVSTFMSHAERGETLRVMHGGTPLYNFIYVKDIAFCVVRALETGHSGIYNIASGEHTSLRELAEAMVKVYKDKNLKISVEPESEHSPAGFPALSIEKAKHMWNFRPLSLMDGLRRYRTAYDQKD